MDVLESLWDSTTRLSLWNSYLTCGSYTTTFCIQTIENKQDSWFWTMKWVRHSLHLVFVFCLCLKVRYFNFLFVIDNKCCQYCRSVWSINDDNHGDTPLWFSKSIFERWFQVHVLICVVVFFIENVLFDWDMQLCFW